LDDLDQCSIRAFLGAELIADLSSAYSTEVSLNAVKPVSSRTPLEKAFRRSSECTADHQSGCCWHACD